MFVQTQSSQPAAPTSEPDLKQLFKPPVLDAEARRRARMRFNRASRQGRGTRDRENCIRNEAMIAAISGPQSSAARTNWFNAWLNLSEDSDKLLEFWMLDEEIKKEGKGKKWKWVMEDDMPTYIKNEKVRATTLAACKADPKRNKLNEDPTLAHLREAHLFKILVDDEEYQNDDKVQTKARGLNMGVDQQQARKLNDAMPACITQGAVAAAPAATADGVFVPTQVITCGAVPAPITKQVGDQDANMVDVSKPTAADLKRRLVDKTRQERPQQKKDPELQRRLEQDKKDKAALPANIARVWVKGLKADISAGQDIQDKLSKEEELKQHVKDTYTAIFKEVLPKLSEAKAGCTQYSEGIAKVDDTPEGKENGTNFANLITETEELLKDFKSDKAAADGILSGIKAQRTAKKKKAEKAAGAIAAENAARLMRG